MEALSIGTDLIAFTAQYIARTESESPHPNPLPGGNEELSSRVRGGEREIWFRCAGWIEYPMIQRNSSAAAAAGFAAAFGFYHLFTIAVGGGGFAGAEVFFVIEGGFEAEEFQGGFSKAVLHCCHE